MIGGVRLHHTIRNMVRRLRQYGDIAHMTIETGIDYGTVGGNIKDHSLEVMVDTQRVSDRFSKKIIDLCFPYAEVNMF